jgi:hypothetical protein
MRIRVEFADPVTGEEHELTMDGPEMDTKDLREIVMDALENYFGQSLPKDLDIMINEVAHGTIH